MNKLMASGGIIILLLGLAMLILPGGRIPLLDANRTILAESEQEAYCSGIVYGDTRGAGNAQAASVCRSESDLPDEVNLNKVQPTFCRALTKTMSLTEATCVAIMEGHQWWPTKDGGLADSWNRTFPYPGNLIVKLDDSNSRTGDRDNIEREGLTR